MPLKCTPNPRADHDDSLIKGNTWLTRWIADLISASTPKCREVVRLVSEGMDRPLPPLTRLRLRMHYLWCCYCRRYASQLHSIRQTARAFPDRADAASLAKLSPEARQKIKDALRSEPQR